MPFKVCLWSKVKQLEGLVGTGGNSGSGGGIVVDDERLVSVIPEMIGELFTVSAGTYIERRINRPDDITEDQMFDMLGKIASVKFTLQGLTFEAIVTSRFYMAGDLCVGVFANASIIDATGNIHQGVLMIECHPLSPTQLIYQLGVIGSLTPP